MPKVMRADGRVDEVPKASRLTLPDGGAALYKARCDFCDQQAICLVIDYMYGEYRPAQICFACIDMLVRSLCESEPMSPAPRDTEYLINLVCTGCYHFWQAWPVDGEGPCPDCGAPTRRYAKDEAQALCLQRSQYLGRLR